VTVGTPTQCDPLNISWTGGQTPFEIILTPAWGTYQNYSIPPSAFNNGKGSYSISPLSLSTGTQFLLTMSDATGFGSGGTTDVLSVGNPVANNNCNTTALSTPYTFELFPSPLTQCSQFTVTAGSSAVLPITIVQLIPGGQPVVFNSNSDTFSSVVDVNAGTSLLYLVTDSEGRQGGVPGFEQVSGSSNSSCLSANSSLSSAVISSTIVITPTLSPTSSSSSSSRTSSSSSSNVALITGVAGGGAVLIALVIVGVCLWCQRRASRSLNVQSHTASHPCQLQRTDPEYEARSSSDVLSPFPFLRQTNSLSHHTRPIQSSLGTQSDLTNLSAGNFADNTPPSSFNRTQHLRQSYGDARISDMTPVEHMAAGAQPALSLPQKTNPIHVVPPVQAGSQSISTSAGNVAVDSLPTAFNHTQNLRQSPDTDDLAAYGASISESMVLASAQTTYQPPIRIIVHTDADDVMTGNNGVIELPPQYSSHWRVRASQSESAS